MTCGEWIALAFRIGLVLGIPDLHKTPVDHPEHSEDNRQRGDYVALLFRSWSTSGHGPAERREIGFSSLRSRQDSHEQDAEMLPVRIAIPTTRSGADGASRLFLRSLSDFSSASNQSKRAPTMRFSR